MRPLFFALAALVSSFVSCRCDTPPEPIARTEAGGATDNGASVDAASNECPPRPEWASVIADEPKLLAEVLYILAKNSDRKGTGMRVYEDGRVLAFDEVIFAMDGGTLTSTRVPGEWRARGTAPAAKVAALRAAVEKPDETLLRGWVRGDANGKQPPTIVTVRRGSTLHRACYRGTDPPKDQAEIEAQVKNVLEAAGASADAGAPAVKPSASAKSAASATR